MRNLQLYRAIDMEYIKKVSDIRYGIENYIMMRLNERLKIEL